MSEFRDSRKFDQQERMAVRLRQKGLCAICGKPLGQRWAVDHIVPYSKGGPTHLGNAQGLCVICNSRKGAK